MTWWLRLDSDQRPNDYEPFALPLSYAAMGTFAGVL